MNRRWLFVTLFILTLGAITAAIYWAPDRDWERRDNRVEVVQAVDPDGNAIEGGATIIVERDRHGFPFGLLLIPLILLLVFGFMRRGPWGPPGDGDRARWLEEWHERTAPDAPSSPTADR